MGFGGWGLRCAVEILCLGFGEWGLGLGVDVRVKKNQQHPGQCGITGAIGRNHTVSDQIKQLDR